MAPTKRLASLRVGSLFSGIGGIDLGLEAAGFPPPTVQIEIDSFARGVLARKWRSADHSVADVTSPRASAVLAGCDLLAGGFPCQDISSAGKRAGLSGSRSGLWFEFARLVEEVTPAFVLVENVASGMGKWLVPVRENLERLGYMTRAIAVSALDVGAPHWRRRVFVLGLDVGRAAAYQTDAERLFVKSAPSYRLADRHRWPAPRGAEPYPWEPPRAVPSKGVADRAKKLKALGNAVVPACAEAAGVVLLEWIARVAASTAANLQDVERLPTRLLVTNDRSSSWPTPTANDSIASGVTGNWTKESGRHSGTTLTDAAVRLGGKLPGQLWPTPTATPYGSTNNGSPRDGRREAYATKGTPSLNTLASSDGKALNPEWVTALMGFPEDWLS